MLGPTMLYALVLWSLMNHSSSNCHGRSQEQDRIIVESKKREREYNLLFRNSLFYVYDGGSRLRILQHCHEMPLVGYFRDFGISFSKLLMVVPS